MANSYFQFKQFTIQQGNCAMKVCTDGCLFGAWVADILRQQNTDCQNILDIGSGTGLLSLMIAQKSSAAIDGVEIDKEAYLQSVENVKLSVFSYRVNIINIDVLAFTSNKKYNWIISNPPFFEQDLKSENSAKNAAKHDTALRWNQLVQVVVTLLNQNGFFAVLLPYHRIEECIEIAENYQLFVCRSVMVKQTPKHPYFRCMLMFSREAVACLPTELIIKNEANQYTEAFVGLLKDYYLHL